MTERLMDTSIEPHLVPATRRIFVNRNLRMDMVDTVGFDMDYTLARYHREPFEALAHGITIQKLIARGYPEEISSIAYDPKFVARGLCVDKQLGNIIKLDRHGHACRVYHGRRRLAKSERRALYRREKINFVPPRFAMVDTMFALPETGLYLDLIEFFEQRGDNRDTWQLFDDTRDSIDEAHRDNSLKSVVKAALPTYVEKDPLLARTLHKLRSAGKKLFVLTNSYWDYTQAVMSYLLDHKLPEYPSWRNYFEYVIVGSRKPSFFVQDEPFAELDEDGQIISRPTAKLQRGHVYQGGNRRALEASLGHSGDHVLYVGDHIYGDILRSKKSTLWRTALVLEELEDEITHMLDHGEAYHQLYDLESQRRRLDDHANILRQRLADMEHHGKTDARKSQPFAALRQQRDATKAELKSVIRKIGDLERRLDESFNLVWGLTFKEDQDNTRFAEQVGDYACIYTSRVSNFLSYSAHQYFRSARDLMPHERDL